MWSLENNHAKFERNFQLRIAINIWCGLIESNIIKPFVLPNRLTFNHVTSNLAELINAWMGNIRNLAFLGILLSIYRNMIANMKNMKISYSMLGELTLPSKFSKKTWKRLENSAKCFK